MILQPVLLTSEACLHSISFRDILMIRNLISYSGYDDIHNIYVIGVVRVYVYVYVCGIHVYVCRSWYVKMGKG